LLKIFLKNLNFEYNAKIKSEQNYIIGYCNLYK